MDIWRLLLVLLLVYSTSGFGDHGKNENGNNVNDKNVNLDQDNLDNNIQNDVDTDTADSDSETEKFENEAAPPPISNSENLVHGQQSFLSRLSAMNSTNPGN